MWFATRWTDFDPAGHVTDTIYPVYLSNARGDYITARVGPFTEWPCVLAQTTVEYRREIPFPTSRVLVRTRISEVGRSSVSFEQEVVREDGELAASSRSVLVAWDTDARRSRTIGDVDRARLLS